MKRLWAEKYDPVSAGINKETIAEDNERKIHNASDFYMMVRYDYTQEKGEISS
jgi:ABC-type transporter lipoprotein component MlaA